jgi:hypothetical protein
MMEPTVDRRTLVAANALPDTIVQAEEHATLLIIKAGLYPPGRSPNPMVLRLMALRLLVTDELGNPRITAAAESALARMEGNL